MNVNGTPTASSAPEVIILDDGLGDQAGPPHGIHTDNKKDLQNKAVDDVAATMGPGITPRKNTNVWNFKRISDQDIGLKTGLMAHDPVNSQGSQNPFNMTHLMSAPGNNFPAPQQNFGAQISNPIRPSINGGNSLETVIDQKHVIQKAGGLHKDPKVQAGFSSNHQNFNGINVQMAGQQTLITPELHSNYRFSRNPSAVAGGNLGVFEKQAAPPSIFPQNIMFGNHDPQHQRQLLFPFPVTIEGHINLLNKCNEQHQLIVMLNGKMNQKHRESEAKKVITAAEINNLKKRLSDQNVLVQGKAILIAQMDDRMKRQQEQELEKNSETETLKKVLEEAGNIIKSKNQEIGKLKQEIKDHKANAEFKKKEIIDKEKEMDEQVTSLKDELAAAQKTIEMKETTIMTQEKIHKNKESVWEKEKNLEKRVLENNISAQNRNHQAERNKWNEEKRKLMEDLKDAISRNDILEVDFEILREKEARKQAEGQELSRQFSRFFGKSIIDGAQCENEEKTDLESTKRVVKVEATKRSLENENDDDQGWNKEKKVKL
ncbi:hypothetical protein GCK72_007004 [Caenorhabditis remanei]|uniref:Uncharacterized protein n=1 Tax=Caenorhabditis remanei TaxID=31234 RepID=A0A6A5HK34_CAERE|nr:hypothetical protein GCK72_007004 [Caenorhabditis remanei]KAF1767046.1 hypothetical protein GCK72_007004 [Caenorhabditis remanei]